MKLLSTLTSSIKTWLAPKSLGRRGEDAAARFLRKLGYIIIARGHRDRIGEIDLIAVDGRTVVFVEVKTRTSQDAGHPADAVDADKQRRLTRLALKYMKRYDLLECRARIDIIAITWASTKAAPKIEHFKNAFEAVGVQGMFS